MHQTPADHAFPIPPIVLLVDNDRSTLERYSALFESEGLWVSTATDPDEAFAAVQDLKPDLVVTEIRFPGGPLGLDFIDTMKVGLSTRDIPLIILSEGDGTDVPERARAKADACLSKPVTPDALLLHCADALKRSRELRDRGNRILQRASELVQHSARVVRSEDASPVASTVRACPRCAGRLEWTESGRIGGVEYDYYRWCRAGCGLYCYDRTAQAWVKLVEPSVPNRRVRRRVDP